LALPTWGEASFLSWAQVPQETKLKLRDAAHMRRAQYNEAWGAAGISAKWEESRAYALQPEVGPTDPLWARGFWEMVENPQLLGLQRAALFTVNGHDCTAAAARQEKPFVSFLKRYYLITLAAYQSEPYPGLRPSLHGWNGKIVQGASLPVPAAIRAQRAFAAETLAEFAQARELLLAEGVPAHKLEAIEWNLRQLTTGNFDYFEGSDALLRPYTLGVASLNGIYGSYTWVRNREFLLTEKGQKNLAENPAAEGLSARGLNAEDQALYDEVVEALADADRMVVEDVNAIYWSYDATLDQEGVPANENAVNAPRTFDDAPDELLAPVIHLNPGTIQGTFGTLLGAGGGQNYAGRPTFLKGGLGSNGYINDAQTGTVVVHLNRWWEERSRAHAASLGEDAWHAPSPSEVADDWSGFAAHMRTLEPRENVYQWLVDLADQHVQKVKAAAAQRCAVAQGRTVDEVATQVSALPHVTAVLNYGEGCAQLTAQDIAQLPGIGGDRSQNGNDSVILEKAREHVLAYLADVYDVTSLPNGKKLHELLADLQVMTVPNLEHTAQVLGKVFQIGTGAFISLLRIYEHFFHELYHVLQWSVHDLNNQSSDTVPGGVHAEGNPMYCEREITPLFIEWMKTHVDPSSVAFISDAQLPNLQLFELIEQNRRQAAMLGTFHIMGGTFDPDIVRIMTENYGEAVPSHHPAAIDTLEYMRVFSQEVWGVSEASQITTVQERSHQGYNFSQYHVGLAQVRPIYRTLGAEAEYVNKVVDPFSALSCNITQADLDTRRPSPGCLPSR